MTSRMRDCGASRSGNGDRMGGSAGIKTAVNRWARATDPIQRGARGQQNPVDLPLRLDDASASPTTPQGQHQQALITETEKELRPGLEGPMRQREPACEEHSTSREDFR